MIGIQGRAGRKGLPRRGGLELGFKEQLGFGEEGGSSRLWKEMKSLALPRDGLLVTQHRESPCCPITRGRADSARRS